MIGWRRGKERGKDETRVTNCFYFFNLLRSLCITERKAQVLTRQHHRHHSIKYRKITLKFDAVLYL